MAKAKPIKGIDCNAAASDGMKLVLVARFEELCSLREAALDWSDPEGVHSMRVASRRLRSALRDFTPYLRRRGITPVQKQLKTIADALGKVRDQDVAIMALEKIETYAPAEVSTSLKHLRENRKQTREQARKELKSILQKEQLKHLESSFTSSIDKAIGASGRKPANDPVITFREMSKAIILDRLRDLEKLSGDLFSPFEIEKLHEMRIASKRLRYAIELFQQCWGRAIITYAKQAARIQSALGDVHDCDVWIENFGQQINDARRQQQSEQVAGFVWLLNHSVKLRTKYLRHAFARWCMWEAKDLSGGLRASLQAKGRGHATRVPAPE